LPRSYDRKRTNDRLRGAEETEMRNRIVVSAVLLAAAGLAWAAPEKPEKSTRSGRADENARMEAWQKAMTPGEMHKRLRPLEGTFDVAVRTWMEPSQEPEDSTGTATHTWVLGDRFLEERFDGTFMGAPFQGIGFLGYDNVARKYVSTWMDTASTGILSSTGTVDASGKIFQWKATIADPMSGKPLPVEEKLTIEDADHHRFEMWSQGPDGKMFKNMEIRYSRKK
jgi:hypothetical protein